MANPIDGMPPETYWETNDRLFVDRSVFDECIDEIEASLSLPDLLNIANMKKENGWVSGDCDWQGVTTFSGLLDLAVKQGEYGCFFVYMCIRESGDQHGDALEKIVEHAKILNHPPPWKDLGSVPASPGDQQLSDSSGDTDIVRFSGARARRDTDETMLDSRRVPEMEEDLKPGIFQGSLDEEEEEGPKDIGSKSVKADEKREEKAAFVTGRDGTTKNAPVGANPAAITAPVPVKAHESELSETVFLGQQPKLKMPRPPSGKTPEPEAEGLEATNSTTEDLQESEPSENPEIRQDVTDDEGDMVATNEAPHVPQGSVQQMFWKLQKDIQQVNDRQSEDMQQMTEKVEGLTITVDRLKNKISTLESQLQSAFDDRDRILAQLDDTKQRLGVKDRMVANLRQEADDKEQQIRFLKEELEKVKDENTKLRENLNTSQTSAKKQMEMAQKEIERLKRPTKKDERQQLGQCRQNPSSDRQGKTGAGREENDGGTVHDADMWTKPKKPNVWFRDIAGLSVAKETLSEAVIDPRQIPHLYGGKNPWPAILLYGPPGTGKTLLAKAVATEADCVFYPVNLSEINCKWVGDSEKAVRLLFERARSKKNAIIFIDEADSLCGKRVSHDSQAARNVKAELLTQIEGVSSSNEGILVLAATNLPWDLDQSFRRRFKKRLYIRLPDEQTRKELFEKLLSLEEVRNELTSEDLIELANNTDGYSGDDIKTVIKDAKLMYPKKVKNATHFKRVTGPSSSDPHRTENDLWTPCDSKDEGAIKMTRSDVPGFKHDKLLLAPATREDFDKAVKNTSATVDPKDTVKYDEFTKDFGQEG